MVVQRIGSGRGGRTVPSQGQAGRRVLRRGLRASGLHFRRRRSPRRRAAGGRQDRRGGEGPARPPPPPGFGGSGWATTSFGPGSSTANGVAIQTDGKIVAAGQLSEVTGTDFALARYLAV